MATFNMLVGLPGSGKSYYAQEWVSINSNTVIISSDGIRQELWGDVNDQQNPSRVFDEMFIRTVDAMKKGKDVIYDATNLIAKTRKATLNRLRQAIREDFSAVCVLVTCSISECKRRQGARDRKVPDEVIDRMVRQFQTPWYNEGWDTLYVVNRGKKQNINREHERMLGTPHDNPHHTHSLGMHCVKVHEKMSDLLDRDGWKDPGFRMIMQEAAYQHDVGKYKTKAFLDSRGNPSETAHYYSHDNVGAYLWLSGDKSNAWTKEEFLYIGLLIQWHMQPFFLKDENGESRKKFEDWCEKRGFDELFCESILLLHEADKAAH